MNVERDTPCTSILLWLVLVKEIPCASKLQLVESDTHCTSIEDGRIADVVTLAI
jgi:hypothetical protein